MSMTPEQTHTERQSLTTTIIGSERILLWLTFAVLYIAGFILLMVLGWWLALLLEAILFVYLGILLNRQLAIWSLKRLSQIPMQTNEIPAALPEQLGLHYEMPVYVPSPELAPYGEGYAPQQ